MDNIQSHSLGKAVGAQYSASLSTPVKTPPGLSCDLHLGTCPPHGSPISGLCSGAAAGIASPAPASSHRGNLDEHRQRNDASAFRTGPLHQLPSNRTAAVPSPHQSSTSPLSWTPGSNALTINTHSMPEVCKKMTTGNQFVAPVHHSQDSGQLRDQYNMNRATNSSAGWGSHATSGQAQQSLQLMKQQQQQSSLSASMPSLPVSAAQHSAGSSWACKQQLQVEQAHNQQTGNNLQRLEQQHGQSVQGQQQPHDCGSSSSSVHPAVVTERQAAADQSSVHCVPIDVLLSPLLPSADESKLTERLSQLRTALDEQRRLAASWEHQAITLQQAVTEGQQESLSLRGQLVSLQRNIHLLGGNLQGRLSLVQGAVLAQMQTQVAEKDTAIAASETQLAAFQAQLNHLSSCFEAKLASEQTERERLAAEAAQARLLCMARGRQLGNLQQELQQLQQKANQQQQGAAASANVQQQQLESLRQQLQGVQQRLELAQSAGAAAVRQASAAEGAQAGLRQQVDELTAALADKELQIEWLEGKVADLEGCGLNQQLKRHSVEISRLQSAAAAERQMLEQQLTAAQRELAQLQQADRQQQQQLETSMQSNAQLQQQLQQQQGSAAQQVQQLEQQLQHATDEVQQLQAELEAAQLQLQEQLERQQQQRGPDSDDRQQESTAFAAAGGSAAADDAAIAAQTAGDYDQGVFDQKDHGTDQAPSQGPSRCPSDAAAAVEHALRAELGMANAEVARLQHELDVARASVQQERQLTGQEILRLQQELSDAAATASGASCGAVAGGPQTAASEPDEVTSACPQQQQQDSTCSWHSVHYNPAFEQHRGAAAAAACTVTPADAVKRDDLQAAHYEARLQDQAGTISSLQQQLKQQQQLLASLQRHTLPELRVHDSAASRSSWVDTLDLEEEPQQQQQRPKTSAAACAQCSDAAVQTDDMPTESAGSTAMAAADAATSAAAVLEELDAMSPHRLPKLQQQQQPAMGLGGGSAWCGDASAAGSALLSAARQEIQRLQELNHQLLQSHAQELKTSVSFDAARRAVSEAKAHTKAKAAALLQASNASWSDKYHKARAEHAAVQVQLQQLQLQHEQLQQQADAEHGHHQAVVQDLQLQLSAAQQRCQQLQEQLASLMDSHAQELDQVRMDVEAEAAAAILDAGAAAQHRSMQHRQLSTSQAAQTEAQLQQQDAAVQTDAQLMTGHVLSLGCIDHQQQAAAAPDTTVRHASQAAGGSGEPLQQGAHQQCQHQQQQQQQSLSAATAERPSTPQPAPVTPTVAAGVEAGSSAAVTAAVAAGPSSSPGAAAAGMPDHAAAFMQSWHHAAAVNAPGDDDMCRMSSVSDTPASVCGRLSRLNSSSRGTLNLPPLHAAAACESRGSAAEASSSTGEYQDCSSGDNCCHNEGGDEKHCSAGYEARPDSASTTAGLPELATAASPMGFSSRSHQHSQQQQQNQQPETQASTAAQMTNWQVELMQQQAQLDLLKLRLSQQQKQQRLHNQGTVGSSSSSVPAGRSCVSGLGTPAATTAAAGGRGLTSLTAAAAAGATGVGSSSNAARHSESLLVPAAGGSSPMKLQQRRQQRQQIVPGAAAAATSGWGYTGTINRTLQQPQVGQHNYASSNTTGLAGATSQQQQPAARLGTPLQLTGQQQVTLGAQQGRYDDDRLMTPGQFTNTATPAPAAGTCELNGTAYQLGLTGITSDASSTGLADLASAGRSTGTNSSSNVGANGAGLVQLGNDVMGALSLSRYHRERSKEQEARAKQHALNAQDALDRAAAVRLTRLSSATPASAGAAAGSSASPRYSTFSSKH